jgi:hypothetical protein
LATCLSTLIPRCFGMNALERRWSSITDASELPAMNSIAKKHPSSLSPNECTCATCSLRTLASALASR